jgi:hypothetical protein
MMRGQKGSLSTVGGEGGELQNGHYGEGPRAAGLSADWTSEATIEVVRT